MNVKITSRVLVVVTALLLFGCNEAADKVTKSNYKQIVHTNDQDFFFFEKHEKERSGKYLIESWYWGVNAYGKEYPLGNNFNSRASWVDNQDQTDGRTESLVYNGDKYFLIDKKEIIKGNHFIPLGNECIIVDDKVATLYLKNLSIIAQSTIHSIEDRNNIKEYERLFEKKIFETYIIMQRVDQNRTIIYDRSHQGYTVADGQGNSIIDDFYPSCGKPMTDTKGINIIPMITKDSLYVYEIRTGKILRQRVKRPTKREQAID